MELEKYAKAQEILRKIDDLKSERENYEVSVFVHMYFTDHYGNKINSKIKTYVNNSSVGAAHPNFDNDVSAAFAEFLTACKKSIDDRIRVLEKEFNRV